MYNINYLIDLGTHLYTYTHPHFQSIYENQSKIKFNFVKSQDENSNYDKYITNYKKTAKDIGCSKEDIDYFIYCIHKNCKYQPKGFGFSPTHGYFGPENYVVNLEHYSSIFTYLYINSNKDTSEVDIYNSPWSRLMTAAFLQPNFKGILCHIKDTINTFKILSKEFTNLYSKFIYFPLASPEASENRSAKIYKDKINVLFTNSFGGQIPNFRLRGGNESFNAILSLIEQYKNLHLITIGPTPIINHERISQYPYHIENTLFDSLVEQCNIMLIPAMRIHTISLVKALCNGIIPIVSDGWGFDEYITHQYNGLISKGQLGHTSFKDKNNILVENYSVNASEELTFNIIQNLKYLLDNQDIYNKISENCIKYSKENFNIKKRNKILEDLIKNNVSYS